jgi:hypothetical protein
MLGQQASTTGINANFVISNRNLGPNCRGFLHILIVKSTLDNGTFLVKSSIARHSIDNPVFPVDTPRPIAT